MEKVELNPFSPLHETNEKLSKCTATFSLFTNISNSEEIHASLMKGEIRAALINPSLIIDQFQVLVAASRSLRAHLMSTMATKSLFTELLFNLSPDKKISHALQTFGIDKNSKAIFAVTLSEDAEKDFTTLQNFIQGDLIQLDNLPKFSDKNSIKAVYKISDVELKDGLLLDSILSRMACKEL